MNIKEEFELICNKYVDELCKICSFDKEQAYWIGDRIGEIIDVNGYPINFCNVRYIVDNKIQLKEYQNWEEYVLMVMDINKVLAEKITITSFENWCKGIPVIHINDIKALYKIIKLLKICQ